MRDALRHSTRVAGGSSSFSLPHFIGEPPHNADGDADGNRIPPQHAASRQTPLNSGFLHRIPPHHAQRIGLRTEKVAGSSPAERAPIYSANRSNSRRPEPSIRRPRPSRFNCTANRRRMALEPILAPSPGPFLCKSRQPPRSCSSRRPQLAGSLSHSGRHLLIDDVGVVAVADLLYGVLGPFLIVHGASYLAGPVLLYEGRTRLVELFAMDASANHAMLAAGQRRWTSCCRWCSTTVRRYRSSILWRRRRRFWPLRVSLARIGERGRLGPPRYSSFSSTRARRLSTWR